MQSAHSSLLKTAMQLGYKQTVVKINVSSQLDWMMMVGSGTQMLIMWGKYRLATEND